MMAVGVAKPIAQGQAIIRTAMNTVRANMKFASRRYQTINAAVADIITTGTK
jgi:hypothetical protein